MRCALCGSGYAIALLVTGVMNLRIMGCAAGAIAARRLRRATLGQRTTSDAAGEKRSLGACIRAMSSAIARSP
jgi:hypothetical protein